MVDWIANLGQKPKLGCGEKKRESQEVQGKSPLTQGVEKNGTLPYKKKIEKEKKNEKEKFAE